MAIRWPDDDHDTIEAATVADLRAWFEEHHGTASGVWIRYWKKDSDRASVTWTQAVDVLLCFGWIDTKVQSVDDDCYVQYFSPRRKGSAWSKLNKQKVAALIASGDMTEAGIAVIDRAKADGSWTVLDASDALIVPDDLSEAFDANAGAREYYESLTDSVKSAVLQKIYLSKRPATRAKWVDETATRLAANEKPPYLTSIQPKPKRPFQDL